MIDIHSHILPGLDDGAQTLEDSLDIARQAVKEGINKIIASPHHLTSKYYNPKEEILEKVNQVNQALQSENIPLEVLMGQEVRIVGDLVEEYENNKIATVNNKNYLLVEFPANHVPLYTERLFYDLQMKGLTPIIVHPERNSQIIEQPDKLYDLVEKGALSQVTAASLTGAFGKKIQKFSLQLIDSNLTHVIASDVHNTTNRTFKMKEAFEVLDEKFGSETGFLFKENAELIIEGQMIYWDHPVKIKRKKFFGLF